MLACICLISLASLQCGRGDRRHADGFTITVLSVGDEWQLRPFGNEASKFLVFLPLVTRNENWEPEGRLAKSWEHSPDYRTWTYHLRTDVRWHDGVPVTAHDVKFTIELLTHPDVLYYAPGDMTITVLDDSTVTVHYPGSRDFILPDWWTVYYPKHLLKDLDLKELNNWEFWTHPVGSGPYRYVRHVPKTMMEFEANSDYYRGKPKIERVILKFGGTNPLVELRSGNVDALDYANANPAQIPNLAGDPRFRVYYNIIGTDTRTISWQNAHPFFRDSRVRRALTLAINRRELLQVVNLPENTPIVDGVYTARQLRRGELPEPMPYDSARARTLLDAAGWRDLDGDGIRERDGKEFRFTAIGYQRGLKQMAVYVQDQLRRVGIRMEVQILDAGVVWNRLETGEYEAAFSNFSSRPWSLQKEFGKDAPSGYTNAEMVRLIDLALVTADPDAQDSIYRQLTEIFRADMPLTFLGPRMAVIFAHRRLRGLISPWRADPIWYMEDLWIEDEK
jgi:peptide/nickel transport system substrate-binding protein